MMYYAGCGDSDFRHDGWPRKCYWGGAITQTTRASLYTLQHLHLQISFTHTITHTHIDTQYVSPGLFLD